MKVFVFLTLLACGAFAQQGPQCKAPNGGGLQPVLEEFVALIPTDKVLELVLTAMTSDPETQAVMEFLSSSEFYQVVALVQSQPAFKSLLEFACSDLYLDAAYYFNILAGILGFPEVRNQTRAAARTAGFRGLLLDILELIPVDELKALLDQKLKSDYYVQVAFQKINSDEFGSIIEALQGDAAYNNMKNRLRGLGVDVDLIIDTISKIFKP
ncbi:unnamed protein product [Hermetia illucens]|uniref:Protein G12 n=1 Tax=Hermetia illucens TaxID=343691 RepID=A0A7R8YUC8_HERIL|nr:uncharacterized protein LOC119652135 [Hermetia illucens]XP_037912004.1 uncharacterized protein LOC119652136 [Hermetia illucens]XP_037912005.1 uncharacterized protein LOC119652137 [Hermetia illucens]CAD7085651.1 unnamed protein product [Hermetia illucens]CAD7085652.1 unnamed protein product [Hermetia illucens]CAD7085653.1 unnamed protein product [Hermetia illucens]